MMSRVWLPAIWDAVDAGVDVESETLAGNTFLYATTGDTFNPYKVTLATSRARDMVADILTRTAYKDVTYNAALEVIAGRMDVPDENGEVHTVYNIHGEAITNIKDAELRTHSDVMNYLNGNRPNGTPMTTNPFQDHMDAYQAILPAIHAYKATPNTEGVMDALAALQGAAPSIDNRAAHLLESPNTTPENEETLTPTLQTPAALNILDAEIVETTPAQEKTAPMPAPADNFDPWADFQ